MGKPKQGPIFAAAGDDVTNYDPRDPRLAPKLPTPDIDDVKSLRPVAKKLRSLIAQRQAVAAKIKALDTQKREFDSQIQPILFRAEVPKLFVDDYVITVVESKRVVLDETKLIQHGVDPELISKCKEIVPNSPYVRIDSKRE